MLRPVVKIATIAALMTSGAAYAGAPGWKVSESSGQVMFVRNGVIKIAAKKTVLAPGDMVKTGKTGRAVLTRGGEYVVVSPNSHIEISEPKKSGKITQIIEYFGNVLFKIEKKQTPHFGVKTPYMAAVVKGTTFSVSVTEEGTSLQVTEGAVEVSTLDGGASEMITPGIIGMIDSRDPFSLNIMDGKNRTIVSPNKGQVSLPVVAPTASAAPTTSSAPVTQETAPLVQTASLTVQPVAPGSDAAKSDIKENKLSATIKATYSEEKVDLAEITGGLIDGEFSGDNTKLSSNLLPSKDDEPTENADVDNVTDIDPGESAGSVDQPSGEPDSGDDSEDTDSAPVEPADDEPSKGSDVDGEDVGEDADPTPVDVADDQPSGGLDIGDDSEDDIIDVVETDDDDSVIDIVEDGDDDDDKGKKSKDDDDDDGKGKKSKDDDDDDGKGKKSKDDDDDDGKGKKSKDDDDDDGKGKKSKDDDDDDGKGKKSKDDDDDDGKGKKSKDDDDDDGKGKKSKDDDDDDGKGKGKDRLKAIKDKIKDLLD